MRTSVTTGEMALGFGSELTLIKALMLAWVTQEAVQFRAGPNKKTLPVM